MPLLQIDQLTVDFQTNEGSISAVKNISFDISKGKIMGLVGESGSGKSVTSLSIMNLIPNPPGKISHGRILFEGNDLAKYSEKKMRQIRGKEIAMIFQEPMTSLNPVYTVGDQIAEVLTLHEGISHKQAWKKSLSLLEQVGIPEPHKKINSYPHELSGGQRQRVMIAIAVACEPKLLIADEPTTALDVTIQKQILELIKTLQKKYGMSVLFITHDLSVVAEIADDVVVMYQGNIVEKNSCKDLFLKPQHPYTKSLLSCRPSLEENPKRLPVISDFMNDDGSEKHHAHLKNQEQRVYRPIDELKNPLILEVASLKKNYTQEINFWGQARSISKAVDSVSLKVYKGRTLGLVGESGCGKTTLGRTILRLIEPSGGDVVYNGKNIFSLNEKDMCHMRKKIQIIFQDPYASLNPRMKVGNSIIEPMLVHNIGKNKNERRKIAEDLIIKCGLEKKHLDRYPHEFSGGQRQRVCIARTLAVQPEFIICDEAVSALDVSVQAQILNLLLDLQEEFGLTYIFISHDLAVVKFFADELAVMNNGRIVEYASSEEIYRSPKNDYTKKLLTSIPKGIL